MGATFHHNLLADHTSRNPRFCGARYHCVFPQSGCSINLPASTEIVDYRNNVIYNWSGNSAYGGEGGQQNMVNNYYKQGPGTKKSGNSLQYRIVNPSVSPDPKVDSLSKWYLKGNFVEGYPAVSNDNANGGGFQPQYANPAGLWLIATTPFGVESVSDQTAQDAYASVLNYGGASLHRDTVDKRIIYQARTGTATTGGVFGANTGIIDSPSQVGGWPVLISATPPLDTDHDGLPDDWETSKGLNPNDKNDGNFVGTDGYTMLEKYVNSLLNFDPLAFILKTSVTGLGIVDISPFSSSYTSGSKVTLTATPSAGYKFDSWSGDTVGINSSTTITMTGNKSIVANFILSTAVKQITKTDVNFRCYPNPVEDIAKISFNLTESAFIRICLFDIMGKQLTVIANDKWKQGLNEISFDMKGLKPGIYFYKLKISNQQFMDRIAIVKQ